MFVPVTALVSIAHPASHGIRMRLKPILISAPEFVWRHPPEPNGKGAQCKDDTSRESSRSSMPRQIHRSRKATCGGLRYRVDQPKAQVNAAEATASKTPCRRGRGIPGRWRASTPARLCVSLPSGRSGARLRPAARSTDRGRSSSVVRPLLLHYYGSADLDAIIEVDHVLIGQADAARRHRRAD